jgi:GNAT superfamily N-acetyltransferase
MRDPHFEHLRSQGYAVRPARLEDVPTAVPMFNAAEEGQYGVAPFTVERYRQEWQAPGFDLDQDTRLVFSPQGTLVGCAEVWTLADPPVHPWIWGRVHPEWEGRGIGAAMLAWSLTRALASTKRVPEGARVAPRVGTRPGHLASTALFKDFGFSLVRMSWNMTIDLAEPPATPTWPDGIHLQPYNHPQDLEAVYRCYRDAFRDHWGFVDVAFDQGLDIFRHLNTALRPVEPDLWFLAMEGSEMAGISICRRRSDDDPKMGWVDILGVRKAKGPGPGASAALVSSVAPARFSPGWPGRRRRESHRRHPALSARRDEHRA